MCSKTQVSMTHKIIHRERSMRINELTKLLASSMHLCIALEINVVIYTYDEYITKFQLLCSGTIDITSFLNQLPPRLAKSML